MTENSNSLTVMIVEDQEIMRLGLRLALQTKTPFRVVAEAEDGTEAVQKAIEHRPDVILMDIGLKTMDGIEATKQIREAIKDVDIIMLTSHESDTDVFAALAAGADGYCLKNISTPALEQAILTVAGGAAWLDAGIASKVLRAANTSTSSATNPRPLGTGTAVAQPGLGLTQRETEVLALLVDGLTNAEIAEKLIISVETAKTHVRHIMEKLAVSDRTQAAVKAMRQGLIA